MKERDMQAGIIQAARLRYHAAMTETEMLQTIKERIELQNGVWYRVVDSRGQSMKGFPDLLTFCPVDRNEPHGDLGLYGLEIKTANDRKRADQVAFLEMLNRVTFCRGEIVRAGPLREREISLDEALELIDLGPRW